MFSLLDPRLWLAVALAIGLSAGGGYLKGRSDGAKHKQLEWDAAVSKANQLARETEFERSRIANAAQSARAAAARDDADRLARALRVSSGLRDTIRAVEQSAAQSADASARAVSTLGTVLDSCRAEYEAVGREAAGHAADSLMYQQAWPK